jgi:hypothetical protein
MYFGPESSKQTQRVRHRLLPDESGRYAAPRAAAVRYGGPTAEEKVTGLVGVPVVHEPRCSFRRFKEGDFAQRSRGIWAQSKADCEKKMSSQVDQPDVDLLSCHNDADKH